MKAVAVAVQRKVDSSSYVSLTEFFAVKRMFRTSVVGSAIAATSAKMAVAIIFWS